MGKFRIPKCIKHKQTKEMINAIDDNVKKYDKVIYTKGKLGLWNYEME